MLTYEKEIFELNIVHKKSADHAQKLRFFFLKKGMRFFYMENGNFGIQKNCAIY